MSPRTPILQVLRGFAMGSADVVPGVSGGTVALVLGIYERLITNIHQGATAIKDLLRRDGRAFAEALRRVEWVWLLSLLVGVALAVLTLAGVIEHQLDENPVEISALFFGLIVGSVVVSWRLVRSVDAAGISVMLAVALAFFLLLGLRTDTGSTDAEVVTAPLWAFFLAGSLAICAMILPGISGAFILVLLGMYGEVLGAVNDRDVVVLAVFLLGCVTGLALFSTLLNWLLRTHHDRVLAVMIGLMLGSLRVLWPWPEGAASTRLEAPTEQVIVPVLLALAGCAVVLAVEWVNLRRQRQERTRTLSG